MGKQLWFRFSGLVVASSAVAALVATSANAGKTPATAGAGGNRRAIAQPAHDGNGPLIASPALVAAVTVAMRQVAESAVAAAMSPRQLAGQRVIYRYSGRMPPASLLTLIRAGEAGGVIFFADNYASSAQFTATIKMLEAANRAVTNPARAYPLLLMTDQEGGYVKRLPGAPYHSEKWIGARATAGGRAYQAQLAGAGAASTLLSFGLNVNLAPVLDVYRVPGDFDDQYQRSYSMNPRVAANLGADFIRAQQSGGVAATAKHFPGLGAATASQNTDERAVTINLSKATLQGVDEYPYAAAVAANVDLVMVSWAVYPSVGSSLPAGLSSAVVQGELRGRLHFHGVTITDGIGARALARYGSSQNRALRAAQAGMQLILASGSMSQGMACLDALEAGYNSGSLQAASFRATVTQLLLLRASLRP
ncbi:MAG TPA: glycoside hydrolase family 3 N-terminal domain-containing protein [Streptosporangiaceae bacterium]|nr:glycoside hydrolase family 3 N-terminal domain-containing protein [Streptosporangiaceae bacterium]